MKLRLAVFLSILVVLAAPLALHAGPNSNAIDRMHWHPQNRGLGYISRNSTDSIPQLVVTVKGMKRFRGADIQLNIQGLDSLCLLNGSIVAGSGLPGGT